jgi:hypothetical protein
MEFGLIIPNIMEGEVLFHLRDPPYWVGFIKFMHVNFWHLIPRVWRTLRGVGQKSMLNVINAEGPLHWDLPAYLL